jgi:sugar O-acyltransferase (sialic acid O-acetyltransferase NeuD family)
MNMAEKLMIIGASNTAELVYEFVKDYNLFEVVGFAVDKEYKNSNTFCGLPVYLTDEIENVIDVEKDYIFVALLWNELNARRKRLYQRLKANNKYKFANLISPKSSIKGDLTGDNCWIHDFVVIQPTAQIGNNVFVMPQAIIAHHAVIEDHCFCNSQSIVTNRCVIGEQTFIGVHATIFDGTIVGKKCIIGACAVVKRNLAECSVCKTASDNMTIKQYPEEVVEQKLLVERNVR